MSGLEKNLRLWLETRVTDSRSFRGEVQNEDKV